MWFVSLALLPAALWGAVVFGWYSVWVLVTSIFSAVLAELAITALKGKITVPDGSAFLTGFLIGMNMPPSIPIYIPVCASVFAIAIVKQAFGGLGSNWMNPALAGRVFAMFSWSKSMTIWNMPSTLTGNSAVTQASGTAGDAITGASPLGIVKSGLLDMSVQADSPQALASQLQNIGGPLQFMLQKGYPVSQFDSNVTEWLNSVFHLGLSRGYVDLFFGNVAGCIGEISVFMLLIGAIFLFAKKIISWEIPASFLGSFALLVWIFGGTKFAMGMFTGDVLFHLLTGGLMLGVFFMATDYVTTPVTRKGMLIFGAGAGFLTFLIRLYGGLPEGVSLAIIIMNMFVPLIDKLTKPKVFGTRKAMKKGSAA